MNSDRTESASEEHAVSVSAQSVRLWRFRTDSRSVTYRPYCPESVESEPGMWRPVPEDEAREAESETLAKLVLWLADLDLGVGWFASTPPPPEVVVALAQVYAMRDEGDLGDYVHSIIVETQWPADPIWATYDALTKGDA